MLWAAVIALVFFIWVFFYHPRFALKIAEAMQPSVLYRVETKQPVVALTLDDGPDPALTPEVLDLLKKHDVHATFFLIGEKSRNHPELVARIRTEGHQIANHMMKNFPAYFLSKSDFREQLAEADSILQIQSSPKLFRPASGWIRGDQLRVVDELGYTCCLGSVYPNDPKHHSPRIIDAFVMHKVGAGDIIILHEGRKSRRYVLDALETLLPKLKKRGLGVVTVDSLIHTGEP